MSKVERKREGRSQWRRRLEGKEEENNYLLLNLQPNWRDVSELLTKPLCSVVTMIIPLHTKERAHGSQHWSCQHVPTQLTGVT